ncbi:MAG: DUF4240 domain-containing protein [Armatimonadetes bacterium]|nr:DUF4240 domain-containing protein [Armatimonadota bacterium]
MLRHQFWEIIERSRSSYADCADHARKLSILLEALNPEEIISFDAQLRELLVRAFRWDVWGAAYIVLGGCSDEEFESFRLWLIGQGEDAFEQVIAEPEAVLEYLAEEEPPQCEELLYAASWAYENQTGRPLPIPEVSHPLEPEGEPWDEEDLRTMFPDLYEACR